MLQSQTHVCVFSSLINTKVQRAIVVTLTSALAWVTLKFLEKVFLFYRQSAVRRAILYADMYFFLFICLLRKIRSSSAC